MQAGDMTGRVALVTGAAAGFGHATAIRLSRAGAAVCLVDIDAANLKATPIRINAVVPGGMMTALAGNMRLLADGDRSLLQRIRPLRGLVEIADVADVADAVAFFATDAASGFHGACINVDKGIVAD